MTLKSPEELRAIAEAATQPVAWRVKDFADGWWLTQNKVDADYEHDSSGSLVEPLYGPALLSRLEKAEAERDALRGTLIQIDRLCEPTHPTSTDRERLERILEIIGASR